MENDNKNIQPAQYDWSTPPSASEDDAQNPVMVRRKIKRSYGWASLSMVLQLLILFAVSTVISIIFAVSATADYLAQNPNATQQQLTENISISGFQMILMNSVGYVIANVSAFFIGLSALKAFKAKSLFKKPKLGAGNIILGIIAILGIQSISIFIQSIIMSITGYTGVNADTSAMLGFSDDTLTNIVTMAYVVILGPITEELLFRGFIMNALSPVDKKFALIASALLFGLMHGNLNQMFNGFLLGLLLGYIAIKSGSIIPSIIAHIAANANAMICSYVYEYKLAETVGDTAYTYEMIHFGVLLVAGIIMLIVFLKKNGKVNADDRITDYSYETEAAERKKLTWNTLIKCPSFWVVTAVYIIMAISSLTVIGA